MPNHENKIIAEFTENGETEELTVESKARFHLKFFKTNINNELIQTCDATVQILVKLERFTEFVIYDEFKSDIADFYDTPGRWVFKAKCTNLTAGSVAVYLDGGQ